MTRQRFACGIGVLSLLAAAWIRLGPIPTGLLALDEQVSTEVVDRGGVPLYESLSAEGGRSARLRADRLPETLVEATLAAEDRRFFRHAGVDPLALLRAAWHNLKAGRMAEGGSTLTQQTAKILIDRPRTVRGKLREMVLALRLEHRLSKRQILALYLSLAPYGNQRMGAEAASRGYFGCPPESLTPAQAAFLAGLPQRPSALDPYRHFDAAVGRQRRVLEQMAEAGYLSAEELERARAERLRLVRDPAAFAAPHFVERVLASVPSPRPRRVETTLDASLQAQVRGILDMHRERLRDHGAHAVAVAVLDNRTAEWLAWEGSGDYFDADHGGAIDGVVSPRQPGSALKPFTYALAFEKGFTPASVLPDLPSHFPTAVEGVVYSPRNYDGVFRGPLRARPALAGSENVPAVWALAQVGVPDLLRLLRQAGLTTLGKSADHYGFALTMGDAEVRLDELVAGYSAFARSGLVLPPRMVRALVRPDGTRIETGALSAGGSGGTGESPQLDERGRSHSARAEVRILSDRAAFWIADILSDPRARAYVFGTGGSLDFPFKVAVKTGTSQAYRDNWTVGFTREVTVGVWVGNFDRKELRNSSGVTGAAPIFHDVMTAAQQAVTGRLPGPGDPPLATPPRDLVPRAICALSGREATERCPAVETEWLPVDRPATSCLWHRRRGGRVVVSWPPTYRSWAREHGLLDPAAIVEAPAKAPSSSRNAVAAGGGLRIVNPPAGATYLRDPTLRDAFQTLPLRAVTVASSRLRWEVDGRAVGGGPPHAAVAWPLSPGRHLVSVQDEHGRRDEAEIVVK
jgi:penicillin-binding protein 1C